MIIDLQRFIEEGRPHWLELEGMLSRLEGQNQERFKIDEVRRFYHLYQRASADLARIRTFAHEPEVSRYLEALVSRAYGEVHEVRGRPHRLSLLTCFTQEFPRAFRRRIRAFYMSLVITVLGSLLGAGLIAYEPAAREIVYPSQFSHLMQSPSQRVAQEEKSRGSAAGGFHGTFSAQLMQNNISVSIRAVALGLTWGIGTLILLFYNGVIVGAVACDYVLDGQTRFLLGWLLPHGSVELPAIIIAGQGGLVLASALIGWGDRLGLRSRLRTIAPDLVRLIFGVAVLLVWAAIIESFFSQYHAPVLPYEVKIAFGVAELVVLCLFLHWGGRRVDEENRGGRSSGDGEGV